MLVVSQAFAQDLSIQSKKWILLNKRIDNNDIYLAAYNPSKLKADSFILQFQKDGRIDYDYETNKHAKSKARTEFLDIDTNASAWQYDASQKLLTLTLKGGYTSIDDFNFKRSYKIEKITGGYVLKHWPDMYAENLPVNKSAKPLQETMLVEETISKQAIIVASAVVSEVPKVIKETTRARVLAKTKNYTAKSKAMLMPAKRWILVGNKITKNVIRLTSFDVSKFRINTLVLNFLSDGKISYDYEMDPELEACAGINFLDIDTDESGWAFDETNNVLTLTVKGGLSSLDDFKFKRDYKIEQIGDEYVLHKLAEHYFIDYKKLNPSR